MDPIRLAADLRLAESVRHFVYDDATGQTLRAGMTIVGNPTVGVGRNLSGKGLSDREIDFLLKVDINECYVDLRGFAWWGRLNDARQNALAELRFWLGGAGFRRFTRTLAALAADDYAAAADEMVDSSAFRDHPQRMAKLAEMMRTGEFRNG